MKDNVPENETGINQNSIQEISVKTQTKNNLFKLLLLTLLGLVVLAGAVYAGIQIGKKQISPFGNLETPPTELKEEPPTALEEVSPAPDQTADWKTYTTSYYSFKYPSDWLFVDSLNEQSKANKSDYQNSLNLGWVSMIGILAKDNNVNIDISVAKADSGLAVFCNKKGQLITINSKSAYRNDDPNQGTGVIETLSVISGNYCYLMSSTGNNKQQSKIKLDQILSTFKFLD